MPGTCLHMCCETLLPVSMRTDGALRAADCWVGCDRAVPVKLKVNELTRAEREGRTQRGKPVPVEGQEDAEPDAERDSDAEEGSSDEEDGASHIVVSIGYIVS